MMHRQLSWPTIELIAGTRMAMGIGAGFLLADCMAKERRREVGWALLAVGALSTIPLVIEVLRSPSGQDETCNGELRSEGIPCTAGAPGGVQS